jgi:hypothetical protein
VTEWELQTRLEQRWMSTGVPLAAETLLLVGREVMTDWKQNDSQGAWNKPSVDFVAIDSQGRLVAIEIKNRLDTRRQALLATVQVTAMALALGSTVSWAKLEETRHRLAGGSSKGDLAEAWSSTFGASDRPSRHDFRPIRRLLAATSDRAREAAAQEFGSATPDELVELADLDGAQHLADRLRRRLNNPSPLLPLEFLAVEPDG